ncbi:hypothetical protein ACP275_01G113300 [Erythranthe tilingii]
MACFNEPWEQAIHLPIHKEFHAICNLMWLHRGALKNMFIPGFPYKVCWTCYTHHPAFTANCLASSFLLFIFQSHKQRGNWFCNSHPFSDLNPYLLAEFTFKEEMFDIIFFLIEQWTLGVLEHE